MVWGFIDGTFRGFCKPEAQQHIHYSGHKHKHGLHFQGIVTPDGLVASLYGPNTGRTNDWKMYETSKVVDRIRNIMAAESTKPCLYLYGDPAYNDCFGVICPYQNASGTRKNFNIDMSRVKIAVENSFGITQNLWTAHAFEKHFKLGLQPVAAYYTVAILLTNCYTCMRGNQTSAQFLMRPPLLDKYLTGISEIQDE